MRAGAGEGEEDEEGGEGEEGDRRPGSVRSPSVMPRFSGKTPRNPLADR